MKNNKLLKYLIAFGITVMSSLAMALIGIITIAAASLLIAACGGGGGGDDGNTNPATPPTTQPPLIRPPVVIIELPSTPAPTPSTPPPSTTNPITAFKSCPLTPNTGGYPFMPTLNLNTAVQVVVYGNTNQEHKDLVTDVFTNDLIPERLSAAERLKCNKIVFATHSNISVTQENPETLAMGLMQSMITPSIVILSSSRSYSDRFLDRITNPNLEGYEARGDDSEKKLRKSFAEAGGAAAEYPLVITAGGNGGEHAECTPDNYDYGLRNGLHSAAISQQLTDAGCPEPGPGVTQTESMCIEIQNRYNACDLRAARMIQDNPGDRGQNWILVGSAGISTNADSTDYGHSKHSFLQKPGAILKHRWITTYYAYNYKTGHAKVNLGSMQGTSFGAPFVAKVAAEVKRRVGHLGGWTNAHIAELLLETAEDIGEPGTDNVYGRGLLNIDAVFAKLEMYLNTTTTTTLPTLHDPSTGN